MEQTKELKECKVAKEEKLVGQSTKLVDCVVDWSGPELRRNMNLPKWSIAWSIGQDQSYGEIRIYQTGRLGGRLVRTRATEEYESTKVVDSVVYWSRINVADDIESTK